MTTTSGLMVDVYLCVYVFVVFFSKLLETLYSNKIHNLRGGGQSQWRKQGRVGRPRRRDFRKRPDVLVLLTTLLDDNRAGLPQGLLEAYRLRGDILVFV